MANAIDYIRWRGDLTFEQSQMNEIDMFLFSQLSTLDYYEFLGPDEEMTLAEAANKWFALYEDSYKTLGLLQSKFLLTAFKEMATSTRFKNMRLAMPRKDINEGEMKQFEAITILPMKNIAIISFRGTDDTLVGWKEDCYLAIMDKVEAQQDAVEYLTEAARKYPDCYLGVVGHSKGGNLSIYSSVHAPKDVQDRIIWGVGYDSPGFPEEFFRLPEYQAIENRLCTVLSQNSTVGLLMYIAGRYCLVHSSVAGPLAHDGFNWEVLGTEFIYEEQFSPASLTFLGAMYDTLQKLDQQGRKEFVDSLFEILGSSGAKTVTEFMEKGAVNSVKTLFLMADNSDVRSFMGKLIKGVTLAGRNLKAIRMEVDHLYVNILNEYPSVRPEALKIEKKADAGSAKKRK